MALQRLSQMEQTSGLKFAMDYPDLRGFTVFDRDGNDIGEVQDLVYDTDTGMVTSAIIGRGWLSSIMEEGQVIVPFDRMTVNPNQKTVHLNITRDQLKDFPKWTEVSQGGLWGQVTSWWDSHVKAA